MNIVILSGRSGSGKSAALNALEDLGFYCVDNLPLSLFPTLIEQLSEDASEIKQLAVGIDARNIHNQLAQFGDVLKKTLAEQKHCEVVFLDARNETLLNRFNSTRRKHPLSSDTVSLTEAIEREGKLLSAIRANADMVIDTTDLDIHTLRNLIRERIGMREQDQLSVMFESFGFKQGVPNDADLVFDVRVLPNPHWDERLRPFNGLDEPIQEFLGKHPEAERMFKDISQFLDNWLPHYETNDRSYLTVAIGCTGGKHRSVYMVSQLAEYFTRDGINIKVRHRELNLPSPEL